MFKKKKKQKQLLNEKALIKVLKGKSDTNISCVSRSRTSGCWFWLFEVTMERIWGRGERTGSS